MRTEPLHLPLLVCLLRIQMRRRLCHMLSSLRCNLREGGRPRWKGGVISWQKLLSALSPWGGKQCSSPPFSQRNERCRRRRSAGEGGEGGGVQLWHTLLPSTPLLLADELSDTTDYSSHYSQRLTSACMYVCMYGLISTLNCVNMCVCL